MRKKSSRLDRFCLVSMIILSLILSIVTGCQQQLPLGTFTDDMGREVTMEKVPKQIVSLAPSHTEILFALGLGDRVVGVTEYCNYPEEAQNKEIVGGFATPDIDKIIALKPDLILSFGTLQKSLVGELEARGQKVFWLYPHTASEVLKSFERIGELVGASAAAQRLIREVEEEIDRAAAKTKDIPDQERPTVFRVMGLNPPATIGGAAFQTDVYHLAGGRNIFSDTDKDYFQFDLQTLIDLDPDIIVICGEDEAEARTMIKDQEGWGELTAVKKDRIVVISCDLICRPSPRIGKTVQKLATDFEAITSSFIKVTDQMGRVVELERIPDKIISLAPSNTEVVYALGLEDKLVGVTEYCDYPETVKEKPKVGGYSTVDLERVINIEPDLILATNIHREEVIPALERAGLPVVCLDPTNLEEALEAIILTGKCTGEEAGASILVNDMRSRIDAITSKTSNLTDDQKPGVFFIMWHDPLMSVGLGLRHDLIIKAGGINIVEELGKEYPSVSLEWVINMNPEVIIAGVGMGSGEDLTFLFALNEERLARVDARINNRIYPIDLDLVGRPGPRIVDGFEQMAKIIHPNIFGKID